MFTVQFGNSLLRTNSHTHKHWFQKNIFWCSLNLLTPEGTLANMNEGNRHILFAFSLPSTYLQYKQTNKFVRCSFAIYVYTAFRQLYRMCRQLDKQSRSVLPTMQIYLSLVVFWGTIRSFGKVYFLPFLQNLLVFL